MTDKQAADRRAGLLGIGWTTLAHFLAMLLSLTSQYVLSRILLPAHYGLFSAAFVAVLIVNLVTDLGIRPGLMRHRQGMQSNFLGTGWLIGVSRGGILTLLLLAFSFVLPQVNDSPSTGLLLQAMAFLPLLHSLQNPTLPKLYFEMKYARIGGIEVGQNVIRVILGITAAWLVPNEWALVIGVYCGEFGFVLLSYLLAPKPSRPRWDRHAALDLSHFGWQVFINTLVMALWWHSDRLLALNFVSDTQLGLYAVAWTLSEQVEKLMVRFVDVYFSMLSRREDEEGRLRLHRNISGKLALYGMPLFALGILLAPLAVRILYPAQFQGAQILFALLMARQMFRVTGQVHFQYLLARAEIYLATRCYLMALAVQLAIFFPLIINFGVLGMAWSATISTGVYTAAQYVIFRRRGIMSPWPMLMTIGWCAAGMAGVIWILNG